MTEKLSIIIMDWVVKNISFFWKYEVSSFHKTYKISLDNFPNTSKTDISISPGNRMPDIKKDQLCSIITKAFSKSWEKQPIKIDLQINYTDGAVTAAVIYQGNSLFRQRQGDSAEPVSP